MPPNSPVTLTGTPLEYKGDSIKGSDLDLRIRAVEAGVSLYANKVAPSLKDYNTNLLDLITKIYTFYGTTKELH